MLMPIKERQPTKSMTVPPHRLALLKSKIEDPDGDKQDHASEEQAVNHREDGLPRHMREAADGGHQRVFDGAFPTLDADDLGNPVEDRREVAPYQGADYQVKHQVAPIDCDACATTQVFHTQADKTDAQAVGDGINHPDQFPGPVAFD